MSIDEILATYRGRWSKEQLAVLLLEFIQQECITFELRQFLDQKQLDETIAETGAKR